MNKKLLGANIRNARKNRKLTSERLSERCHINATYLRQIEAGTKVPSLPVFVVLCQELQVSASYLLSDVTEPSMQNTDAYENQDDAVDVQNIIALWQQASLTQKELILKMSQLILEHT